MFSFYKRHNDKLYNSLVKLSRNIFFYKNIKLSDKFETRVVLIFFHFAIILKHYKINIKKNFPQEIYDNIFLNIEYNLRELGYGDISVNKQMKNLNKIFYDILIKLNDDKYKQFKINHEIINKHLINNKEVNANINSILCEYFNSFYHFCFELDPKSVVEGRINFKY